MLREGIAAALREQYGEDGRLLPAYDDYCFANVPGTIGELFGVQMSRSLPADVFDIDPTEFKHVVLLLLDGLGLPHWQRDRAAEPLLRTLTANGRVTPLTSIYPSETAAAITTLHTGRTPVEHGLLGWDQYFTEIDGVLQTLPFRTPEGEEPTEVYGSAADPAMLFAGTSLYPEMAAAGGRPHLFVPEGSVGTTYSTRVNEGATVHGYDTVAEQFLSVRRTLEAAERPTYCYAYLPHIDGMAHRYGTDSEDYAAVRSMCCHCAYRELVEELDPDTAAETLVIATADHGHVDTDPERVIDLLEYTPVVEHLERDGNGDPIPPVGGPRNTHLHLTDGGVPIVREFLETEFDVWTATRSEALDMGLFGPGTPADRFHRRCGDLLAVHRDQALYHAGGSIDYIGMHGGLHPDEMLVPFAVAPAAAL
ncbi:MAG: alkaline phosphatase family protein [Halobacteriales archaeon]